MVGCNVGKLVKKPCSFLKVKSRFIRNNPVCVNQLVPEFNAHSTDCELSPSDVNVSIGICWDMFLLQKCYYLMVLYWSWIMSDLSDLIMVRVQFCCFKPRWWYCTYLSRLSLSHHHISSLKKQRTKIKCK